MGKIYTKQTKLRIQLTVSQILTDTSCEIRYKKPSGAKGSWDAVIGNATTGVIYYDIVEDTDINEDGTWKIWAHVTWADKKSADGEASNMVVHVPGT